MRNHQIEAWALAVIERVEQGQPIEDSRVELKANWIEPEKAARRIAGHANAARGEPILWLIGVDEAGRTVPGINFSDLSSWYNSVKGLFDELAPEPVSINVPANNVTVAALYFETDRAPYVVKNSAGGAIQREVPWREATGIKSATRSQLLRLLSPLQKIPDVEILGASLTARWYPDEGSARELEWFLQVRLYFSPKDEGRVVIPNHRCSCKFKIIGCTPSANFINLNFQSQTNLELARGTSSEAILDGPGALTLSGTARTPMFPDPPTTTKAKMELTLRPLGVESQLNYSLLLSFTHEQNPPIILAKWTWVGDSPD